MLSAFSFNLHFFFRWYADPARLSGALYKKLVAFLHDGKTDSK
jgi:hypothetical protein